MHRIFYDQVKSEVFFLCILIFLNVSGAYGFTAGGSYAVLRGSTAKLSCIPRSEKIDEINDLGTSYSWTDEEGKDIADARYTQLETGELLIVNAHIGDSGIYKCKVHSLSTMGANAAKSKVYDHKFIVYEISGHKFVSRVFVDMSRQSTEVTTTLLRDLLNTVVCGRSLCTPGPVKLLKCELLETKVQMCEFSVSYEAINQIADEKCGEDCIRQMMINRLTKAERNLEAELLLLAENRRSRLKADMKTFDTRHLITCNAGYHLVEAHYKRCFPCQQGSYSGPNSSKCHLCDVGRYQEHYGRHSCDNCPDSKTTDTVGAKSRDECVAADNGVLSNIKEGLKSIFGF